MHDGRLTHGLEDVWTMSRLCTTASRVPSPQATRALVDYIEGHGVAIGSADKVLAVSALLSREKSKYKSDRAAGGWTLIDPDKEETPQGASTPAGSDVELFQPVPDQGPGTPAG